MTDIFAKMLYASQPQCSWSNIDTTLWLLAFPGQARANCCNICFSLSHTSKDCELASDTCDNQPSPPSQYLYRRQGYSHQQHHRRLIYYQWNEQRSQTCSYPNCCYDHVCYICALNPEASDINHKAIFCPHCYSHHQLSPRQSQTTPSPPKPLMPTVHHGC